MKRWRWVIALGALVVIALVVAAFRRANDDLEPFRPYSLGEESHYYTWKRLYKLPRVHVGPYESTLMTFENLPPQQLKAIAASDFYKSRGWTYIEGKVPEATLVKTTSVGTTTIHAYRIMDDPNDRNWVYLYEIRPLSSWDVFVLRIERIGRNPFDDDNRARN